MLEFGQCFNCNVQKDDHPKTEYQDQENDITDLMVTAASTTFDKGDQAFKDQARGNISSMSDLNSALLVMSPIMSTVQNDSVDVPYKKYVGAAMMAGSLGAGAGDYIKYALRKEAVNNGIVDISKYYSNKFFNEKIIPKIQKYTQVALTKGVSSRELYNDVRNEIDTHFKSVRYWNGVANNSASRAFSYGLCKGGVYAGYTIVRFDAVMDSRTSQLCKQMNGTEWSIHDALNILEQVCLADPDEVKDITPWITAEEQAALSDDELIAKGVIVPPLHFHCRSTLQIY